MKWLKRSTGTLLAALGAIGVVTCATGIVALWIIREQVDDTVARVFDRVDEAVGKLEVRAEGLTERITSTRRSVHDLNAGVQQRIAQRQDVPAEEAADIDELERQLYARLDRARIEFMQASVDLVQQITEIVESSALFLKRDAHTAADLVRAARTGKEELEKTDVLFEEVKTHLAEIRANRNLDGHATQFTSLYSRIDGSLEKVQNFAGEFEVRVKRARSDIADDGATIRKWLFVATVILTFALIWIALAQTSLAIDGWQILRSTFEPVHESAKAK
jgi:hypothetical protein